MSDTATGEQAAADPDTHAPVPQGDRPVGHAGAGPDTVDALTRVLVRACRELAEAGRPQDANRLAARGWSALRADHPRQAEHLNGAMHYIARLEQALDERASTPAR